jgi:TRAP-type C4-dicarboxylate transport system permease small subunit
LINTPHKGWWSRVELWARAIETWLIVAILGGLVLLGAGQIVLRNVFSIGLSWGDGLARLAVFWLALLGGLAASREARHITMGALARWFPARVRRVTSVCADLFGGGVSALLAWHSLRFVLDSREFGDLLLDGVPAWWLQAVMPVAFALMALQFLVQAVKHALGRVEASVEGLA